jgi:hypothetical protein
MEKRDIIMRFSRITDTKRERKPQLLKGFGRSPDLCDQFAAWLVSSPRVRRPLPGGYRTVPPCYLAWPGGVWKSVPGGSSGNSRS